MSPFIRLPRDNNVDQRPSHVMGPAPTVSGPQLMSTSRLTHLNLLFSDFLVDQEAFFQSLKQFEKDRQEASSEQGDGKLM